MIGTEEAEGEGESQQCHVGRKVLPWHAANRRELEDGEGEGE